MYAIQSRSKQNSQSQNHDSTTQCTPNILPCRIHHDGPINSINRFWVPVTDAKDNTKTAHFRGHRLRGRRLALPDGYQGIVATPTERVMSVSQPTDGDGLDGAEPEELVKILETQNTFNEFVVWGHEVTPAADDAFVKGVEEWIRFAETMHTTPTPERNPSKKSGA